MVYRSVGYLVSICHFEVDSTESVWYSCLSKTRPAPTILKLTPQSQYGIIIQPIPLPQLHFEVDSTESVWYTEGTEHHTVK